MTRRLAWAGFGLVAALGSTNAHAQSVPPHVRQYARQIHQVRVHLDQLSRLEIATPGVRRSVQAELGALDRVYLNDGRLLRTDNPSLSRRVLESDRIGLATIANEVDALDDGVRTLVATPGNVNQLKRLDTVLLDSRFRTDPIDRLRQWLNDRLLALLTRILAAATSSPGVTLALAVAFLLAAAGATAWTAQRALSNVVTDPSAQDVEDPPLTSRAALERAGAAATAGDYRSALRALLQGTLLELQERGALQILPGMTNRELLHRVREEALQRPSITQPLLELVDAFDRAWYGHIPVTESAYRHYQGLARHVLAGSSHEHAA